MKIRFSSILTILIVLNFSNLLSQETRALWVTRWNYKTANDIQRIIDNAAEYNFNVILFQVRGDGTVNYPSDIEPWSKIYNQQNPGWDPLQLAVTLAHAKEIELHAWVNVYPAWSGTERPISEQQLYNAHPDWFMVDKYGRKQFLNTHYVFISPTHPDVSDHLLDVCSEIYHKYDVDGIHLDYIRYPSTSYSWDPISIDLFKKRYDKSPGDMPYEWSLFRRAAVTEFVAILYAKMKLYNPRLVLSASVIDEYSKGKRVFLQDSHEWLSRGIIDAVYPMIYTDDDTYFTRLLTDHLHNAHARHIYPGVEFRGNNLLRQLKIAKGHNSKGSGLFSYGALFPDHSRRAADWLKLKQVWQTPVKPAPMPWKSLERDSQGPHIVQVQTIPVKVISDIKFKIAAKIVDQSGVYDDKSGSEGKGVYLIYGKDWPDNGGTEVQMSPVKNNKDWFITDKFIPPLKAGLDFRCRIFAWDNYFESENHPKRNLGYSDIWSLSVLMPTDGYVSNGTIPPVLESPTILQVDGQGKIWVATDDGRLIKVFSSDGSSTMYSPISHGQDGDRNSKYLGIVCGMTFMPPSTMYVSTGFDSLIIRFNTATGKALPGIETSFKPGELDADEYGNLYVLELGSTRFHVITSTGLELEGSPYGTELRGNDIAVLENSGMVFISDQSTNQVQCWKGAVEGLRSKYWRSDDLPNGNIGFGKVAVDSSNFLYVAHSQRGIITIFNQARKPVSYLSGGFPMLNAPREIAVSPTSDTLYVLEEVGPGPVQISSWVRKKQVESKR